MKTRIPSIKKLTAKALTQPQERIPTGDYHKVIIIDRVFNVKIKSAIETHELTDIKYWN